MTIPPSSDEKRPSSNGRVPSNNSEETGAELGSTPALDADLQAFYRANAPAALRRRITTLADSAGQQGVISSRLQDVDTPNEEPDMFRAMSASTTLPSSAYRPVVAPISEPGAARSHRSRPPTGSKLGIFATLILVLLVAASAIALALTAPDRSPESTSFAGAGLGTPSPDSDVPPTPVRADATANSGAPRVWTLPDSTFDELPPAEGYGAGWHIVSGVTLAQQPGTAFQMETRYYVDGEGNRIRIMLVRYIDDAQFAEAFTYFADEIQRYQDTVYASDNFAPPQLLQQPLTGCDQAVRAAGLEWVTSFPIQATLCRSDEQGIVMLVSVNGTLQRAVRSNLPLPADVVTRDVLNYVQTSATPTP